MKKLLPHLVNKKRYECVCMSVCVNSFACVWGVSGRVCVCVHISASIGCRQCVVVVALAAFVRMSTAKMRVCLTVVRPNGSVFVSACVYLYLYLTACLCECASVYVCVSIMWEMRMWSLRWHINVAFNNTKDSITHTHSHFKIVFHTRTLHTHTLKHTQPLERPKSPRVERVSRTIRSSLSLSPSSNFYAHFSIIYYYIEHCLWV